jgi:hypothetical protein
LPFTINAARFKLPDAQSAARGDDSSGLSSDLLFFLESGTPPVVFTLGSSAVMDAGEFYRESAEAARLLGVRALLLAGSKDNLPLHLPEGVAAFDYAPYSEVFPRAAAIVHQGGVGTTGQAMRAGVPVLVMPYSHDQPDHAARMRKLGIGLSIPRARYTAASAARVLNRLLQNSEYSERAAQVGKQVRQENGVGCRLRRLGRRTSPRAHVRAASTSAATIAPIEFRAPEHQKLHRDTIAVPALRNKTNALKMLCAPPQHDAGTRALRLE